MLRTAAFTLLFVATIRADNAATDPKASYPQDQREIIDRLERIQSLQRAVGTERIPFRRAEGLERIREEVEGVQAALHKRLTGDGVKDWVGSVKVLGEESITFEVTPGLHIRASHAGMDGLTRGAVKGLQQGQTVTVSVAPVLLADVVLEGSNLVAIVGGRYLSLQRGRPK